MYAFLLVSNENHKPVYREHIVHVARRFDYCVVLLKAAGASKVYDPQIKGELTGEDWSFERQAKDIGCTFIGLDDPTMPPRLITYDGGELKACLEVLG